VEEAVSAVVVFGAVGAGFLSGLKLASLISVPEARYGSSKRLIRLLGRVLVFLSTFFAVNTFLLMGGITALVALGILNPE
jgi:hypothetical protein